MARILLIEDEPQHTILAKIRLKSEGFEVDTARNGAESVAAAEKRAPDLILMDLILPDMGPGELITALRSVPAAQKTPIIVFTALDTYEIHRRRLDREIDGLVLKPYETTELMGEIRRVIKK